MNYFERVLKRLENNPEVIDHDGTGTKLLCNGLSIRVLPGITNPLIYFNNTIIPLNNDQISKIVEKVLQLKKEQIEESIKNALRDL